MRRYILSNMKVKLLALVVSIMLWLTVSHMGESKMNISVRLSPERLPRDLIITKVEPEDVLVTVSGPVSSLRNVKAKDVTVPIDLSSATAGSRMLDLRTGNVQAVGGIKVEEIKPEQVLIETDRIVEKRLRVVVKLDPKWTETYRVKSVVPAFVAVEGAAEFLRGRSTIETQPVDVHLARDEEVYDAVIDQKGLLVRSARPQSVRVTLKRQ